MAKKAGVKLSDEPHAEFSYCRWGDDFQEGAEHEKAWDVLNNIIATGVKHSIEMLFEKAEIYPDFVAPTVIKLFLESVNGFCEIDLSDVVDYLISDDAIFYRTPEIGHAKIMAEISTGLKALAQKLDDAVEQAEKE